MRNFLFVFIIVALFSGCFFSPKPKPLPVPDPADPNVWSMEKCKDVPKVWWGVRGQDPSKWDGWHCGDWKIYDKRVAP